ncbi:MAG: hypothetical protein FJ271_12380 [Planctomycetes bacterium]|nr:hypothetical protein [Planctomycetota bacterium]
MIEIVLHRSGKWLIALNPCHEKGDLIFEYAWTGWTWAKGSELFLYFDSRSDACAHLKANRNQLEIEFFRVK